MGATFACLHAPCSTPACCQLCRLAAGAARFRAALSPSSVSCLGRFVSLDPCRRSDILKIEGWRCWQWRSAYHHFPGGAKQKRRGCPACTRARSVGWSDGYGPRIGREPGVVAQGAGGGDPTECLRRVKMIGVHELYCRTIDTMLCPNRVRGDRDVRSELHVAHTNVT